MKLKIGEKEFEVTFGYEPTLKSRLLSRVAKISASLGESDGDMETIEDMLLFIPDILLIGLQKNHSADYGYNLDTKEGYDEAKAKVFSLVAEYLDDGKNDAIELFEQLQEEMTSNGFLKKMFEREVQKETQKTSNKKK